MTSTSSRTRRSALRGYFFASILPSSTAGWSNGSTPSRCAAMIVSSMKCISSSPRLVSSSFSTWMVRTGQPFLASVSAVARPCAATRSPMVLPAKSGSPASLARSASMRGPRPAAPVVMTVNSLSRGPAMKSCSWLCWSTGPARGDRRRALAVLAEAFGPELHVPAREALEPVGIGHHHRDGLALMRDRQRGADARRARRPVRASPASASARGGAGADRVDVEAERCCRQEADIGQHREAAADTGIVLEHRDLVFVAAATRRPLALAALGRLGEAEEKVGDAHAEPGRLHRRQRGGESASGSRRCRRTSRSRQSARSRAAARLSSAA